MTLRHHHQRFRTHRSAGVRFAYLNFIVNGVFTLIWGIPVMVLIFLDPQLAASVKWVSFLSVWALFATHAGAAIAAYAAIHAAENNTRLATTPPSTHMSAGATTKDRKPGR